eukprot:g2185.t1
MIAMPTVHGEERDMFSAAFKNSLTERRHAVRVAAGRDAYASLAGGYRSKMEAELQEICSNALALLGSLVSSAEPGEAKTFFLKMQGDYYRYLAEWTTGPAKSEVAGQAMNVYKQGMGEAMRDSAVRFEYHRDALMMAEGDASKLKPVEKRCRTLWNVMIAPLLTLSQMNRLENRQPDLLKYLLHCLLGTRGMVFGVLATRTMTLPSWEEVAEAMNEDTLAERMEALRTLGFRGPKPRKTCWAGSVWVKDEYPRNPDSAPWQAFQYVDREDADVLGQGKPGMKNEAFRWNRLCHSLQKQEREWEAGFKKRAEQFIWEESPGFKWDGGFGGRNKLPIPSIHDKIQLTNRLFVDEALAQCVPMTGRLKLVGEKLLCPLLIYCAESLKKPSVGAWLTGNDPEDATESEIEEAEVLAVHRDMLRYVASQAGGPPCAQTHEKLRVSDAVRLSRCLSRSDLENLTSAPEEVRWQPNQSRGLRRSAFEPKEAPEDQAELLPEEEIRWFKRRQSTQAYVQLRLCGAIGCVKDHPEQDFLAMAAAISRTQPRNFAPAFWMASYGLLLWGRARQLRPSLEIALRKRLIRAKWPQEDANMMCWEEEKPVPQFAIYGPHLIPLAEVLGLEWSKGPAGAMSKRVLVQEGEQPLPVGPVNMLRTEIVCRNVESLLAAYDVLTEDPEEEKPMGHDMRRRYPGRRRKKW